jgi:hypothetical protein
MFPEGIYKNPIFLNAVTHRSVRVAPVSHYKFAKQFNSVLIVGQEFLEAAKFYPIVFSKPKEEQVVPMAIIGIRNNDNLFVDADGQWREGAYIPAFFRRYPFILASNVGDDGSFAVCVDSQYEGFGNKEGMVLFEEDGETSEAFKKIIDFLRSYQAQHDTTREMVGLLEEYKLFKDVSANLTLPAGEKLGFAGLMIVDEMAMFNLEDERIIHLFRSGYLAWIYAHLYSLSNFRTLTGLASKA